ncbi:MAG: cytochrome c [Proteobacteria bacterium]|nr:cytochrome c [Pseudomonadota bacterium]
MRTLLLMLIAAAVGVVAAVQITAVLRERDAYPRGVMDVMAHHAGALDESLRGRRCGADATSAHFGMLVAMSGEIPRAFPALMQDRKFAGFATQAHTLDQQFAANPPADCAGLQKALTQVGDHCDECHRQYR